MKRLFIKEGIIIVTLVIMFSFFIFPLHSSTGNITSDANFKYQELANGNYELVESKKNDEFVELPSEYNKKQIEGIQKDAISDKVTALRVPDTYVYFDDDAFSIATNLDEILISSGSSDTFVSRIKPNSSKRDRDIKLTEYNSLTYSLDHKEIDNYSLKSGMYVDKEIGDNLSLSLTAFDVTTYEFSNKKWNKLKEPIRKERDMMEDVTWYFQSSTIDKDVVSLGSTLDMTALSTRNAGVYTASYKGEVVFEIQVNVGGTNGSIDTMGKSEMMAVQLLALSVLIIVVVLLLLYKRKLNRREWKV